MWSTPIDLYCERLGPSFWAEPFNAASNFAFIVAAAAAFNRWRQEGSRDPAVLALIAAAFVVGLGSFAFHTLATRGAMLLDVIPIGIFIYAYFLFALCRMLVLSWPVSLTALGGFAALSTGIASFVPRAVLNGSTGYFPALAALLVLGTMLRKKSCGRAMLAAAAVFIASITLRIIDLDICPAFPTGTHFLWHILNAIVLYLLLRAALAVQGSRAFAKVVR